MHQDKELTEDWVREKLPERPGVANKGTFGKVLVIAGSKNYPGAPYLSCAGSYRAGAGLVTLVTIQSVKTIVSRQLPEVTFLSYGEALEKISGYNVLLVGPGLGQGDRSVKLMEQLFGMRLPPTIIDGDGLNILSKMGQWWEKFWTSMQPAKRAQNDKSTEIILTPHPGEMARLTGLSIDEIQKDRSSITKNFAKKWGAVVVLKGANTIIASPAGKERISPFVNSILSTAGTGDVLSGIIAGLIAQGLTPFDAAAVGAYIHGLAGEMIQKKLGNAGMLAGDLLPQIPLAIKKLT